MFKKSLVGKVFIRKKPATSRFTFVTRHSQD